MGKYSYYNLRKNLCSNDINVLFPDWDHGKECLAVFGAHDDDPLLGAGYAMTAAMDNGAEVYVVIFCQGDCGYSTPQEKDTIVEIRRKENENALAKLGIKKENIIRFEYPDFSLEQFIGKKLSTGESGLFSKLLEFVRNNGITRAMIPNGYREHIDHTAAFDSCIYNLVQFGDPIISDIGKKQAIKSYLQYSVWSDFSPEDFLTSSNDEKKHGLRANRAIICPEYVEENIHKALLEYTSQQKTIINLMAQRRERRTSLGYLELYIALDPRPKLDYLPYVKYIEGMMSNGMAN